MADEKPFVPRVMEERQFIDALRTNPADATAYFDALPDGDQAGFLIKVLSADPGAGAAFFDGLSQVQQAFLLRERQISDWARDRVQDFIAALQADPVAATADFDARSEEERAFFLGERRIRRWNDDRQDDSFDALQADPEAGTAGFDALSPGEQDLLLRDLRIQQWAQARVDRFIAGYEADPARMTAVFDALSEDQRAFLLRDPRISRWAASRPRRRRRRQVQPNQTTDPAVPTGGGIDQAAQDQARDQHNADMLCRLDNEAEEWFCQAGLRLAIGQDVLYWPAGFGRPQWGRLRVTKPLRSDTDPVRSGMVTVTGCADQAGFRAALGRIPPDVFLAELTFV